MRKNLPLLTPLKPLSLLMTLAQKPKHAQKPPSGIKMATTAVVFALLSSSMPALAELTYSESKVTPYSAGSNSSRVGTPYIYESKDSNASNSQSSSYQNTYPQTGAPQTSYPAESSYPSETYANNGYSSMGNTGMSGGVDNSLAYFGDAEEAGKRQDSNTLYDLEQQMNGGLFAMYPAYWRLNNELSTLNPGAVTQFARQYSGSVMAEKLAADYAEIKARAGDYAAVRQVADLIINADESEKCAIGLGFNNGGDVMRAMSLKADVWLSTKKQKDLCKQLASEMNYNPMISNADRKARLLRMLRIGETGEITALTQALGTPIDYSTLSQVQQDPNGFLNRFNQLPPSEVNQYLYLYAIGRIADKSYSEAAMQVDFDIRQDNARAQHLLSDATRRYAYRMIAVKRMNYNTDDGFSPDTITWFRNSLGEPFNFEEAEDYAQAAIRFSEWNDLVNAIGYMDVATQEKPIWQYWLARAYENTGDSRKQTLARAIYKTLAQNDDYYGLLAKDKVGQKFSATREGGKAMPQVSASDMSRMMENPNFARAFALYNSGASRQYANREWNWAVRRARANKDYNMIVAAAKHAHDLGWLDRAIYAIQTTDGIHQYALSHPMPYQDAVTRYSRQVNIDPAWAYGIMRQESRFVSNAQSGVGASGLMQVMPATAKYIARSLGEPYSASRANSGDTNIRYGTWYMGDIMSKLDYQPVLATAGYNAGPSKARRWQPTYGTLAADQYVDTINYPETRDYVKKVMANATIYGDLLGSPMPITQRMGTISP